MRTRRVARARGQCTRAVTARSVGGIARAVDAIRAAPTRGAYPVRAARTCRRRGSCRIGRRAACAHERGGSHSNAG